MHYIVVTMSSPVNPVTKVMRRYFVEFSISMVAYCATIAVTRNLLEGRLRNADPRWQIAIAVLPVIPVLFTLIAIVRVVRGTDEFQRRIYLESLAIAGSATAMLAATYGLLESERFPHLSAWWTYATFMTSWLVASFFVRRRYR